MMVYCVEYFYDDGKSAANPAEICFLPLGVGGGKEGFGYMFLAVSVI
jgi:hypothetical protein